MKRYIALSLVLIMVITSGTVLAQGAVCPIDATNLTAQLPEGWSYRELMPTDTMNGVLLVAQNADESLSLDVTKELYTAEEMQAKIEAGCQALEFNGIPYVMEETENGIWYYMTELSESSVLTFAVYADSEAFAANKQDLEQLLGSLTLSADAAKAGGRHKGRIKSFNNRKGFGYIISDDGDEIFLHYTGLNTQDFNGLEKGRRVSFNIIEGQRGPQATNVTLD